MARVKRGVTARARHKKVLAAAKGYYNARRKVFRVAKRRSSRQVNTPTATARRENVNSASCGLSVSTPVRANMAFPTAASSTA